MPAYTPLQMAQSNVASLVETTVYTVPGATNAIVKQIVLANVTGLAATISISIVPSGGAAGDGNRIVKDLSLPATSISVLDLMQDMDTGDFISVKQGTSSAITTTISGVQWV
mgnify:CR=1 FL=1